jgi:hypothetical protein
MSVEFERFTGLGQRQGGGQSRLQGFGVGHARSLQHRRLGLQAGQFGIDELQTLQLCLGVGRESVEVVILIVYFHHAHGECPFQLNVENPAGLRAVGL